MGDLFEISPMKLQVHEVELGNPDAVESRNETLHGPSLRMLQCQLTRSVVAGVQSHAPSSMVALKVSLLIRNQPTLG